MTALDDPLYQDSDLVEFYDLENDARDDFDFCTELAKSAGSVLDLGCGTGQLAAAVAEGKHVVGVDPAGAMLEIARHREGGDRVRWVEASAQSVRLGETFDLIVLTGHAFQVFLTDDDVLAVLKTITMHLTPTGQFIFDTRNPADKEWRNWTPETSVRTVVHPFHGKVKAWNDVVFDDSTSIATYQTFYEIATTGRTLSASSQIRFIDKERLESLLTASGLKVDQWLGGWNGSAYEANSRDIIPVGRVS